MPRIKQGEAARGSQHWLQLLWDSSTTFKGLKNLSLLSFTKPQPIYLLSNANTSFNSYFSASSFKSTRL